VLLHLGPAYRQGVSGGSARLPTLWRAAQEDIPGSDCNVVLRERRVSVTPLHLDLTDELMRAKVALWSVDGFKRYGEPTTGQ